MFEITNDNVDKGAKLIPISSITVVKGDLLELLVGATSWTLTTSASEHWTRKAIAQAAATTADSEVLAIQLDGNETVKVESANNSNTSHNGDRMLLTDANTANNTGTDNTSEEACFIQDGAVGAAADKRITGRVMVGKGMNPDAA